MKTATLLASLSLAMTFGASGCGGPEEADDELLYRSDGSGNLSLEWTVESGGEALACSAARVATVSVVFSGDDAEFTEDLDCGVGTGETGDVPADDYDVTVVAYDPSGALLAELSLGSVTIEPDLKLFLETTRIDRRCARIVGANRQAM